MSFPRLRTLWACLLLCASTAAAQVVTVSPVVVPIVPSAPIVPIAPILPGAALRPLVSPALGANPVLAFPQVQLAPVQALPSAPLASVAQARTAVRAQAPAASALLQSLHDAAAANHHPRTYGEAEAFLYSKADNVVRDGMRGIVDAYSGIFVPGTSPDGSDYKESGDQNGDGFSDRGGMNVEHTWPQSFFSKQLPMRTDLHHLLATFMHPNGIRSNLPFGEVRGPGEYSNSGGAKMGQGVFEPPDAAKGRVARAVLYFYTRYFDRNIYNGAFDQAFWNDNIEMFLRWNRQFPPTQDELRRNDLVEQFQGNRNPYVDDPSLADRVGADGFRRVSRYETYGRQVNERFQNVRLP
ncbi:MAG: endonuclease [Elusimicrobia bacterium]|nr:endonuclease [Elusimicrobiota bacterium]